MTDEREEQIAALVEWIAAELGTGASEEEVTRSLRERGLPHDQAREWVGEVSTRMRKPQGSGTGVGSKLLGLVVILILFGLFNGVLYVGQEVMARDEVAEAEALEAEIENLDQEISLVSQWLEERARESESIDELGQRLDEPARHYSSQDAYERDLAKYNLRVDEWNAESVPKIETAAAAHDSLVEEYNALVEEYHEIAEEAYSRWWLLPIPIPRGRSPSFR